MNTSQITWSRSTGPALLLRRDMPTSSLTTGTLCGLVVHPFGSLLRSVLLLAIVAIALPASIRAAPPQLPAGASQAAEIAEALDEIELGPLRLERIPAGAITVERHVLRGNDLLLDTRIRVGLLAPSQRPRVRLQTGGGATSLEGQVRSLELRCLLGIPPYARNTRIEVAPGDLSLEIQATSPTLQAEGSLTLDTEGRFLAMRSTDRLRVDVDGVAGSVDLRVTDVPVGPWSLRLAEGDSVLELAASAVLSGQSRWKVALDTGQVAWDRGKLSLSDLVLSANPPVRVSVGPAKLDVGKLTLGEVAIRRDGASTPIQLSLTNFALEAGQFSFDAKPSVRGRLSAPVRVASASATLAAAEGTFAARDVLAIDTEISLADVAFDDGSGTQISVGGAQLRAGQLSATMVQAHLHLEEGRTSEGVTVHRLDAQLDGTPSALGGTGELELSAGISSVAEVGIQETLPNCSAPVRVDVGLELARSLATVAFRDGTLDAALHDFSGHARAKPQYYRCEWDHRIGEIPEVKICAPLVGCAILSPRRDVKVRWIAELHPTLVDTLVLFRAERVRLVRGRPVLCRPLLFVTPNLYAGSVHPNFPDDPILRPFRDLIRGVQNGFQGGIASGIVNLAATFANGVAVASSPFCAE